LDAVLLEDGVSVRGERLTPRDVLSSLRTGVGNLRAGPISGSRRALLQLVNALNHHTYYGDRDVHHRRILGDNYEAFDPRLRIMPIHDINSPEAIAHVRDANPDLVFVHGTRLIRRGMLETIRAPFVNLHWGWSPDYRAEGILSALALEGPRALGVTVHLIDEGIDSGSILYRSRPTVDPHDNFYSIALKLTVLGTDLFLKVSADYARDGKLVGVRQATQRSQLFSGKRVREHPEWYRLAWKNLRSTRNLDPRSGASATSGS
jgi:methionyl-tRNA formyltransferase